jgi:hypothetical protein
VARASTSGSSASSKQAGGECRATSHMSDIKQFRIVGNKVTEEQSLSATVEKSLQKLIETHLDAFLGVRFLDTEIQHWEETKWPD